MATFKDVARLGIYGRGALALVGLTVGAGTGSAWGQAPADALTQAHAMHQSLEAKPVGERTPADYEAIVAVLAPVWAEKSNPDGDTARFEAGSLYVDMAQELHQAAGYTQAEHAFLDLLHASPYTAYRRNAEWALAQVQIFHEHEPKAAAVWLRDFVERYPADPRATLAQRELRGETLAEPAILSASDPKPAVTGTPPPLDNVGGTATDAASEETPPEVVAAANRAPRATATNDGAGSSAAAPRAPRPAGGHGLETTVGDVAAIHVTSGNAASNVVIALHDGGEFTRGTVPESHLVYFDVKASFAATGKDATLRVEDGRIRTIHIAENRAGVTRIVIALMPGASVDSGHLFPNPSRLVVSVSTANK